jgi:hypothetical protein
MNLLDDRATCKHRGRRGIDRTSTELRHSKKPGARLRQPGETQNKHAALIGPAANKLRFPSYCGRNGKKAQIDNFNMED